VPRDGPQMAVVESGQTLHGQLHGEWVARRAFRYNASLSARHGVPPLEIEIVPCLSDNYAYLVKQGQAVAVVDPSEPGRCGARWANAAGG